MNTYRWYGIARRWNKGWCVRYMSDADATWLRSFCEIKGPFPIRDIARLACGQRLSRGHFLCRLHGDNLMSGLQSYGMAEWEAWEVARVVDERTVNAPIAH